MKICTPLFLWAAAVASIVAVIPILPASHRSPEPFFFEARLTSSAEGHVQVYYDLGAGISEANSSSRRLQKSDRPALYRLPIPAGECRALRFDPIDRDGTVTLSDARIVSAGGRTVRAIPLPAFRPANQIQSLREAAGRLEIVVTPGGGDPQLTVTFQSPVALRVSWLEFAADWALRAAALLVILAGGALALDSSTGLRSRLVAIGRWIGARPSRAVLIVAAAAVVASAYPVVFLGKSYVSPNYGTYLLYEGYPTLPKDQNERLTDVMGSDVGSILWQFVPFSAVQHRALRHGEWPVWDRYNSGGTPLLAQGYSMFGDPLHLIPVLARGAAWAWDLKFLIAKWLFAAALGLIVLAVTRHLPAALIVALAAPFDGFFLFRFNHPAFFSFCYGPWVLYCWLRLAQTTRVRAVAGWAAGLVLANFALLNSGTVKEAYMILLALNFSGVCVLLASEAPWRVRLAKLGGMAWAGVLFVLFSSPIWYSFLSALRGARTSYDTPHAFQIQPSILLGAFDEAFYRPIAGEGRVFNPAANFLILAGLLYFLATLRQHFSNRALMAIAASSLLPLSLAFGLVPPSWIEHTPFLANVAHIDNSFSCALIALWSVLAGAGFAAAAMRLGTRDGRGDLLISGLFLFALVFGFVAFRQAVHRPVYLDGKTFSPLAMGQTIPVARFLWVYLAALLAALTGIGWLCRRALAKRRLTPAAAVLLALCVIGLLWRQGLQAESFGFESHVVRPAARSDFHAVSGAVQFALRDRPGDPSRTIGLGSNLAPGWSGLYGLESVSGPDPLVNPYYQELTRLSPVPLLWGWRVYLLRDNMAASRPYLDFLNVRYYLDLPSGQAPPGAGLRLDRKADLDVYESPSAWPRAFFTDRLAVYQKPEDIIRWIVRGDGRPFAAIQADELAGTPGAGAIPSDLSGRTVVPASHYRLTENSTAFEIDAPRPGVAVLSETWWPGYPSAEVDGRKAPVLRLNHAFEGVIIAAPGIHHLVVRYAPPHFTLLLWLAFLALVLAAGTWVIIWRQTTPREAPAPPFGR